MLIRFRRERTEPSDSRYPSFNSKIFDFQLALYLQAQILRAWHVQCCQAYSPYINDGVILHVQKFDRIGIQ